MRLSYEVYGLGIHRMAVMPNFIIGLRLDPPVHRGSNLNAIYTHTVHQQIPRRSGLQCSSVARKCMEVVKQPHEGSWALASRGHRASGNANEDTGISPV